jgi:hypothetical protein
MADDFCQSKLARERPKPGPQASLSRSVVITLALFGQWVQFKSERAFYRYAEHHLRAAFPHLPDRTQFNRLMREHRDAITGFGFGSASSHDQVLASTLFTARQKPTVRLPSAGRPAEASVRG